MVSYVDSVRTIRRKRSRSDFFTNFVRMFVTNTLETLALSPSSPSYFVDIMNNIAGKKTITLA